MLDILALFWYKTHRLAIANKKSRNKTTTSHQAGFFYAQMRKQLKKKRRSCPMCKPHKMQWANRWKPKDRVLIKRTDQEIRDAA